jgi:hypothetical protein
MNINSNFHFNCKFIIPDKELLYTDSTGNLVLYTLDLSNNPTKVLLPAKESVRQNLNKVSVFSS